MSHVRLVRLLGLVGTVFSGLSVLVIQDAQEVGEMVGGGGEDSPVIGIEGLLARALPG
jgi:hypothetical protein